MCKVSDSFCHITGLCQTSFDLCKTLRHRQGNCCNLCVVDGEQSTERHTGYFCKGKAEKAEWAAVGVSLRLTVTGKPPGSQGGVLWSELEEETPGAPTDHPKGVKLDPT